MHDLARLWDLAGNQGDGIRIAMLDTGIDRFHPAFDGITIIETDLCGQRETPNLDSHGTQCCGTICAVAPKCILLSGRILVKSGSFTTDALLDGLFWAASNDADIICICTGDRYPDADVNFLLKKLHDDGRTIVAAIGNGGDSGRNGLFPARYPDVLAVGTADDQGTLATFTELAPDKEVVCLRGLEFSVPIPGGRYSSVTGTSMSAAMMSGLLSLCRKKYSKKIARDIGQLIVESSDARQSERGKYRLLEPGKLFSRAY